MRTLLKLDIQYTPLSTWGITLANQMEREEWDKLRHEAYKKANHTCLICGTQDRQLNAHEVWNWDLKKKEQVLFEIICICKLCHEVIHWGRSSSVLKEGHLNTLRKHWAKVNNLPIETFEGYRLQRFLEYKKRRLVDFKVIVNKRTN